MLCGVKSCRHTCLVVEAFLKRHAAEGAAFIKAHVKKPVAGFIAGVTAPPGKRMGHAGAIVSGGKGTAEGKLSAMRDAGVAIADTPSDIGATMAAQM